MLSFLDELLLVIATDLIGDVGEMFREGYEEQKEVDEVLIRIYARDKGRVRWREMKRKRMEMSQEEWLRQYQGTWPVVWGEGSE